MIKKVWNNYFRYFKISFNESFFALLLGILGAFCETFSIYFLANLITNFTNSNTSINIVAGVSGMSYKSDQGWKETLSKVAEAHPQSALASEVGKKSIKQIKTEQVVKKHRARQNAKNK